LSIEEIELPVITHMDDLAGLDAHFFTYPEVKIGAFYLSVMGDRRKNSNKMRFDISQ
jgi:hypothetical protein